MENWPDDRTFKFRHVLGWLLYIGLLGYSIYFLWLTRESGGNWPFYLMPALVMFFPVVSTGGACIDSWMEGASRSRIVWWLLLLTVLMSLVYALWMGFHNGRIMIGGAITLFRRTNELWSVTFGLFFPRLEGSIYSVVICVFYAWLCIRIMAVMFSGEKNLNIEQAFHERAYGEEFDLEPVSQLSSNQKRALIHVVEWEEQAKQKMEAQAHEKRAVMEQEKHKRQQQLDEEAEKKRAAQASMPSRDEILCCAAEIITCGYHYSSPAAELMNRLGVTLEKEIAEQTFQEAQKALSHAFAAMQDTWCPIPPYPETPFSSPLEHARSIYPWMSAAAVDTIMMWIKDYYLRG